MSVKSYCENGTLWIPISQFAREYHKSRMTIVRWIEDGFIFRMGYSAKRDLSGRWYIGQRLDKSAQSARYS